MNAHVPTVTSKGVRAIVAYATARGLDFHDVINTAGVRESALQDPDGRVTQAQMAVLWEYVATELGDPAIALSVGRAVPFGTYDVLDYAFATSPTVASGLEIVQRYFRLFLDYAEAQITVGAEEASFGYALTNDSNGLERYSSEFGLAIMYDRLQHCAEHGAWTPRGVTFVHDARADEVLYRQAFHTQVEFGAEANALIIPRSLYEAPMKQGDAGLNSVLARHADSLLGQHTEHTSAADDARRVISDLLLDGNQAPNIDDVAARLGTSGRTLQRKLSGEDTTFATLLDDVRYSLAMRFLSDPNVAIGEVAFLLGFSEPSAFNRAFRRWSGQTPGAYRRGLAA